MVGFGARAAAESMAPGGEKRMNEDEEDVGPLDPATLFDFGEDNAEAELFDLALRDYQRAWEALPEPKEDQELAIQILAAISDCEFHLGHWEACHHAMQHRSEERRVGKECRVR